MACFGLSPFVFGFAIAMTTAFGTACRCGSEGPSNDVSASTWSLPELDPVTDASLTEDRYLAMGLAAPDRNWGSEDMNDAALRLQAQPEQLPRQGSVRSGRVFGRIVARENLDAYLDPSIPASIRLPAALVYAHGLNAIHRLYLEALRKKTVAAEDSVALYGAEFGASITLLKLVDEFSATLTTDDPKYATRVGGISAIREAVADLITASLRELVAPRFYGLNARRKLVGYCLDAFPTLVPKLPLAARQSLADQLRDLAADADLSNLQPQLETLFELVGSAVRTGARPTAP